MHLNCNELQYDQETNKINLGFENIWIRTEIVIRLPKIVLNLKGT